MTDQELLEAAAKAAGYKGGKRRAGDDSPGLHFGLHTYTPAYWNPLTDYGDAARLAVKLRMTVEVTGDYASAEVEELAPRHFAEPINGDACKAWCRAIVRAAAAMAA